MNKKPLIKTMGEKGQTAVEYILLFAVVAVMLMSLMRYVQQRVLGNPDDCEGQTGPNQSMTCKIYGIFNSYTGDYSKFRYYRIL